MREDGAMPLIGVITEPGNVPSGAASMLLEVATVTRVSQVVVILVALHT